MKKSDVERALYDAVTLTTMDNEVRIGYLVPAQYLKGRYTILPFNDFNITYTYPASSIKSIQFLRNGITIK